MPGGKNGASLSFYMHSPTAEMNLFGRSNSTLHQLQLLHKPYIRTRYISTMYPSSYGKLWNPGHGIVFASKRQDEIPHPRVDMLRSLYTTTPATSQTTSFAAEAIDDPVESDDDDAPFSTAPEYQSTSGTVLVSNAPSAGAKDIVKDGEASVEVEDNSGPADPPLTSLDFKVSLKAFREAQNAQEGSAESFWSYTIYRGRSEDGSEQKVKVHYCKSKHTMERVCQYFLDEKVIGFDLEWSPDANRNSGPKMNISLIQIASESRIALFHVALFPTNDDFVAPTFRKIMEDPDVRKVGVAIKADCTRMRNHLAVDTKGIFELSHLYKLVKYSKNGRVDLINKKLVPLAILVKEHLGLPMFKGQDVRSSDWSQSLNMAQLMYSASDAYAGFQLYHVLEEKRGALEPTPPRPYDAELNLPIRLADGVSIPTMYENTEAVDATLSAAHFKAIKESLETEPDGEGESIAESIRAAAAVAPKRPQKDPRVSAADEQVASYRASIKTLRATPSAVRSYYIWRENNDLNPEGIAKILREPPLQTNTVVSYILEAIKLEKLPFDKKRLRNEILHLLPKEVLQGRYRDLMLAAHKPDTEDVASLA